MATLVFVSLLMSGTHGYAKRMRMVLEGARFRPYAVAAPAPTLIGANQKIAHKLLRDIHGTILDDIAIVRALDPVPPKSYLAPEKENWTKPIYKNWSNVGASGLIRVGVEIRKTDLKIGFRFFDIASQKELLARVFVTKRTEWVTPVHGFLDEVIKLLTGEPGPFASQLAFVRSTKEGKAIYLSDIDGHHLRQVTDPRALSLLPAWDRQGQHLLFTSYLKGNSDLFRLNIKSKKLEWLSNKRGVNMGAAVSPDGKKIALTLSVDGDTEIYVMQWDGTGLTRLTNSWGQDVSSTWSPDGTRIAFVSSRSGQPHIYVMNADGSEQKRLTFQGNYNQEPAWSPRVDGEIVFTARDENLMYDIFSVHPNTGVITRLTQDEGYKNERPTFSPDGLQVVFTSDRPPQRGKKLYIMNVDGTGQRRISRLKGDYEDPAWGPLTPTP